MLQTGDVVRTLRPPSSREINVPAQTLIFVLWVCGSVRIHSTESTADNDRYLSPLEVCTAPTGGTIHRP
jgi:hypothetical protein